MRELESERDRDRQTDRDRDRERDLDKRGKRFSVEWLSVLRNP